MSSLSGALTDLSLVQARVPSYEETHAEVQGILLPPTLPKGVSVQLLQPLSRHFALTHRVLLESGKPASNNPFAAMMGGGPPPVRAEGARRRLGRRAAAAGAAGSGRGGGRNNPRLGVGSAAQTRRCAWAPVIHGGAVVLARRW